MLLLLCFASIHTSGWIRPAADIDIAYQLLLTASVLAISAALAAAVLARVVVVVVGVDLFDVVLVHRSDLPMIIQILLISSHTIPSSFHALHV